MFADPGKQLLPPERNGHGPPLCEVGKLRRHSLQLRLEPLAVLLSAAVPMEDFDHDAETRAGRRTPCEISWCLVWKCIATFSLCNIPHNLVLWVIDQLSGRAVEHS